MNLFKLFQLAKKLSICTHFLSFFRSVAMLRKSKKPSTGHKTTNFRLNPKSLNEFNNKKFLETNDPRGRAIEVGCQICAYS